MVDLPLLAPLPICAIGAWSVATGQAYLKLYRIASATNRLLSEDSGELRRLEIQLTAIEQSALPLLNAFEGTLPPGWISSATGVFEALAELLKSAMARATEAYTRFHIKPPLSLDLIDILFPGCSDVSQLFYVDAVRTVRTNRPGRPPKVINPELLHAVFRPGRRITTAKLARTLKVSRAHLNKARRLHGLRRTFSNIEDHDLDTLIRSIKLKSPEAGLKMITSQLLLRDVQLQRWRIREAMARIDPIREELRRQVVIKRRTYEVPRPNAVWHGDGWHKLIKYGIVVYGFIDGYCRTALRFKVSNNNRASTALAAFHEARKGTSDGRPGYGTPSRLRCDRGGENVKLAIWMIRRRGPNRGSMLWGSSTLNTRIERLWVDLAIQVGRQWRVFFIRLERRHGLDPSHPEELWLLQVLFMPQIQLDLDDFQDQWNNHKVRGKQMNQMTPNDKRLLGMIEHGMYDSASLDPENSSHDESESESEFQEYYDSIGAPGPYQSRTGAGHPSDESDSSRSFSTSHQTASIISNSSVEEESSTGSRSSQNHTIQSYLNDNIRHPPIKVARHSNPFDDDEEEDEFLLALSTLLDDLSGVPAGYGVTAEEWGDEGYGDTEELQVGGRRRQLEIQIPQEIWLPRAVAWVKALDFMRRYWAER